MAKLERTHFVMIIAAVILLVVLLGFFRIGAPTGLPGIQGKGLVRLNMTVPQNVCILNVNFTATANTTRYAYGTNTNIPLGADTDELSVNYTNAGNARHNVSINASYWQGPNGTGSITCNQTRYHNSSGTLWSSSSDACGGNQGMSLGLQAKDVWSTTYLRVRVPSADVQSGVHNQNISLISSNCPS